ncbi:MAG: HAMP domain-containing histidine kinase [Planctomycetes bacterium]|nr:HAMP domain-containing histidine kinase [Planctomycetota bacterium]
MADQPNQTAEHTWSLTERELASRLSWFISIRWFAGLTALAFLAVAWHGFGIRFTGTDQVVERILAAVMGLFFYNAVLVILVWVFRVRGLLGPRAIHTFANVQIVCDLVCVAVIWHYTGGIENAFCILFVFPMVWASELLSRTNAYLHAVLGATLLNGVAWGEYTGLLDHVHLVRVSEQCIIDFVPPNLYRDWAFVVMVCLAVSGGILITVFLAGTIARRLRLRENQLEEAYRKLQTIDTLKTNFMRQASHELRAPLSATYMMLKTVEQDVADKIDPKQHEMIVRATERVDSLTRLVNDLLLFSRLEGEVDVPVHRRPMAFDEVVRQTIELLTPSAEAKNLRLEYDVGPAQVVAEQEELTEIVTNLISNAIRYTPEGGRVSVRLSSEIHQAVLEVADTGIGIGQEDLPRVFDEFFRSNEAKKAVKYGTGIGLAIVKKIVQSLRGTVDVRSIRGEGTTFTVRLPLAARN